MKKTPTILLLLGLLLLVGCNDPKSVTDTLHRAEALMNEHPDSAWAVLNTLSADEMGQNRTRALYALLYTQAQDKTYRDETNDSLISIAVDYYRRTDDVRRKFLSYYYKGRVHFNAKDYLNATTYYMEAEQLADVVGDDYLTGLLYAELGRIYDIYYDYPKSLEAYQKAADCYGRAGKIRHRNYMWLNQSGVCRNMKEYDKGKRLLRLVLAAAKEDEDYGLMESCLGDWVMLYIKQGKMTEAKELYTELQSMTGDGFGSSAFWGQMVHMYASEQDFVQAKQCLEKGWSRVVSKTDSINLYLASACLHRLQGEDGIAYQEQLKGVSMQNKEVRQVLQQPVLTIQRDFFWEKLEFEAYRLRMEKRLNLLYILFSVLFLVVVIGVFMILMKKNKKEARRAIVELQGKKEETEKEKERIIRENERISDLLHQLDEDKKTADCTIELLKNEIVQKQEKSDMEIAGLLQELKRGKESFLRSIADLQQKNMQKDEANNLKISNLLKELEQGKLDSNRIAADLKQRLVQKEEEGRSRIAFLSKEFEREKAVAIRTIQDLNVVISQKEESRQKMMAWIQRLENDNQQNAESIDRLHKELRLQEAKYLQYVQESEDIRDVLKSEVLTKKSLIMELLKRNLSQRMEWILLHEEKWPKEGMKEKRISKRIAMLKEEYFVGDEAFGRLEELVDACLDGAMSHFREEISLASETDYRRVCCLFTGMPTSYIAWIMGETTGGIYQRKSRLLRKIASSSCLHKEIFTALIG